jgi:hypothetical protein
MSMPGDTPEALQERKTTAMKLRITGMTYEKIGEQLGVSAVQAYNYVITEIRRRAKEQNETADDVRNMEVERLDRLLRRLEPALATDTEMPSLDAVETYLKVLARRAKLLGLDAPVKREIDDKRDQKRLTAVEILDKMAALQERIRLRLGPGQHIIDAAVEEPEPE